MKTAVSRIDIKTKPEIKELAQRAAESMGISLTSYLEQIIRADAPHRIVPEKTITLTEKEYQRFLELCEETVEPSEAYKKAIALMQSGKINELRRPIRRTE